MGSKSGHITRHRGIIRATQARRALNVVFALILAATMTLPVYAGDILRGGATRANDVVRAQALANTGQAQALKLRANAQDRLARTTQALQNLHAAQAAARAAAANANHLGMNPLTGAPLPVVPDGLGAGGLDLDRVVSGAKNPTQVGNTVTVEQTAAQAMLHWKTFNVGRNTTLNFDQSAGGADAGKWIAFNKVTGADHAPSQILGRINAQGQVYVLNQNGIIFGGASQINTRSLVASSLPINDNLVRQGLLNQQPNAPEFLFSAIRTGSFDPQAGDNPSLDRTKPIGNVVVQQGAQIRTSVSAEGYGGRVMLVGPEVRNDGVISTPAGQTVLAAGLQVGIDAFNPGRDRLRSVANVNEEPASLRGVDVYVGALADPSLPSQQFNGRAINNGIIESARGSIVLTGRNPASDGALLASTTVDLNGRIEMLASYDAVANTSYDPASANPVLPFLERKTGLVQLGQNSVLQILPDWNDKATLAGTAVKIRSQIKMLGQTVHFGPGSLLLAPNASVNVSAGEWVYRPTATPPDSRFVSGTGQIFADRGSLIDVSGSTGVFVPLSHRNITVQLRGSELADSPLQRLGSLRGIDLTLDLSRSGSYRGFEWIGTPLGDVTGYANLIQRNVGQLTMTGGDIFLRAGGSLVVSQGSILDASGGYAFNEGGTVRFSRLNLGGKLIDIADAFPDTLYDGIFTGLTTTPRNKYGLARTYALPLAPVGSYFDPSHLSGANAGRIALTAPSMVLDGTMQAARVLGPKQLRNSESSTTSRLPVAGALNIAFEKQASNILNPLFPVVSQRPPQLTLGGAPLPFALVNFTVDAQDRAPDLASEIVANVALPSYLFDEERFGSYTIKNADGDITVPAGTRLTLPVDGSLTVEAANINVAGSIVAPGADIRLTAYNFSPYQANLWTGSALPAVDPLRGFIRVLPGSTISTAGRIIDERRESSNFWTGPLAIAGGDISLQGFSVSVAPRAALDVSGGAILRDPLKISYGDAGELSLLAGRDPGTPGLTGGVLDFSIDSLAGFSGRQAGTLSLQAGQFLIGAAGNDQRISYINPRLFRDRGFAAFNLAAIERLEFAPAVDLAARVTGALVDAASLPSVAGPRLVPTVLEEGLRNPAKLSFFATGASDPFAQRRLLRGNIVVGEGARLTTDSLGEVALTGETVTVRGAITSPGGKVTVTGSSTFPLDSRIDTALPTVHFSPNARLSVAGRARMVPDLYEREIGVILPGGSIRVSGNIIAEAGSLFDVSGAAGMLDLTDAQLGRDRTFTLVGGPDLLKTSRVLVQSSGGSIRLSSAELLVMDGSYRAAAGGALALGGTLDFSSGRYVRPTGEDSTTAETNLEVRRDGPMLMQGSVSVGQAVVTTVGQTLQGMGYLAADRVNAGGFSRLELSGNVLFRGPVSLGADESIFLADGGVVRADDTVSVTAPYIRLGQPFRPPRYEQEALILFARTPAGVAASTPFSPTPTAGNGAIAFQALLIDAGHLLLDGISRAELSAPTGDIRGNGGLVMAGDMVLRAGQVYAATDSRFDLFSYDRAGTPGSVTILPGSSLRPLPLAAGGSISVMASAINQSGTLRAPLGRISLGWDGSGSAPLNEIVGTTLATPVSTATTLAAGSVTSVSAVDPLTGRGALLPFGISPDGLTWVSPRGVDVTLGGLPEKNIVLSGRSVIQQNGSLVDISGGGDFYAYRWLPGPGGSRDLLASSGSFAVMPSYGFGYAPYAPFNPASTGPTGGKALLDGDPGYVNSTLQPGDRVTLRGTDGLPAGTYTLLPARYALLPGAALVTPLRNIGTKPGEPLHNLVDEPAAPRDLGGGVYLTSGVVSSSFGAGRGATPVYASFEVLTGAAVRDRADYRDFFAGQFIPARAAEFGVAAPRLAADGGQLSYVAREILRLEGAVRGAGVSSARGSLVDIVAEGQLRIAAAGATGMAGEVLVDAARLSALGAESLLVGGRRSTTADGTKIEVKATGITVDNAKAELVAPEVILAANRTIDFEDNASVISRGTLARGGEQLLFGETSQAGSGDGVLVRVSADPLAGIQRRGAPFTSELSQLSVGRGALVQGAGITLDSTFAMNLDPAARLVGTGISLQSGRVSVSFDDNAVRSGQELLLSGTALSTFEAATFRSLLSYGSLDFLGSGQLGTPGAGSLRISAAGLRGLGPAGSAVTLAADEIVLENRAGPVAVAAPVTASSSLTLQAGVLSLGGGDMAVRGFESMTIDASRGVIGSGTGSMQVAGNVQIDTPLLTAADNANSALSATGDLTVNPRIGTGDALVAGSGGRWKLDGESLSLGSTILLSGGSLRAEARSGDLTVIGRLDASGREVVFGDVARYVDGGDISLVAGQGNIALGASSVVTVAAHARGGHAGVLDLQSPRGSLAVAGELGGQASSAGGRAGSFTADLGSLPALSALSSPLLAGGFREAITLRVRNGAVEVDGNTVASRFELAADAGDITVTGSLNASGETGGHISLVTSQNLTLADDSLLSVHGRKFSNAGKGGQVSLEAGSAINGVADTSTWLTMGERAVIDLSVDEYLPGSSIKAPARLLVGENDTLDSLAEAYLPAADAAAYLPAFKQRVAELNALDLLAADPLASLRPRVGVPDEQRTALLIPGSSAFYGQYEGTLHLRAPQNAAGNDLQIAPLLGQIHGGSSILAEGFRIYNLDATSGLITSSGSINASGGAMTSAMNVQGSVRQMGQNFLGSGYQNMVDRLIGAGDPRNLGSKLVVAPGAEISKANGNISLGSASSNTTADWDLSTFRFGPKNAPGVLSIRSSGDLVFHNALSDGFAPERANTDRSWLWLAPLMAQNPLLPVNTQSWSYRLTAGADLAGAGHATTRPLTALAPNVGTIMVGKNAGGASATGGVNATTASVITAGTGLFQVIRTGSGSIDLNAGRDIFLLNPFASVYTAGTRLADATHVFSANDFVVPRTDRGLNLQGNLGVAQQIYPAQYAVAGGDLRLDAGGSIERKTANNSGLIDDSSRQMPVNWLYRRGYLGPDGSFGQITVGSGFSRFNLPDSSTSWWVDYSNFFQGIGALGGGDIRMTAGVDVKNMDAVIPTTARAAKGTPSPDRFLELGGGDLLVQAGRDINAGVYYVERGRGVLQAGSEVKTNPTRSPSTGLINSLNNPDSARFLSEYTWLPTTLFLGRSTLDVSARGDIVLGPAANVFLLPQGLNNRHWYKTYFSTYGADSAVRVTSFGGNVDLRNAVTAGVSPTDLNAKKPAGFLEAWFEQLSIGKVESWRSSVAQPWLRLAETEITPFVDLMSLLPPTLQVSSLGGDLNIAGHFNLFPAASGQLELLAGGSVNALRPTGLSRTLVPGRTVNVWSAGSFNLSDAAPFKVPSTLSPLFSTTVNNSTQSSLFTPLFNLFDESGAETGKFAQLQTKTALHAASLLHGADDEPLRIYAGTGDISGLQLFAPKMARLYSGRDISDVALYLQNVRPSDISAVAASRDILLYNDNSPLRLSARAGDNALGDGQLSRAGDIKISGPGSLQVVAGRHLDLGTALPTGDRTGEGITSIGNVRNPYLPFAGADLYVAAGLGGSRGLSGDSFDSEALLAAEFAAYQKELGITAAELADLSSERRAEVAVRLLSLVLRDAGRRGDYDKGYAAVANTFGPAPRTGNIDTRQRDIRTRSGGDIRLLAPGGRVTLATDLTDPTEQPGILTEFGGALSLVTGGDVDIGNGRIFTLRGGNIVIWSSDGDIAAGAAAKTVASAPPTRVRFDSMSSAVETDLSGLFTGGGIGVLATVAGVPPGDVDLVAPRGTVDAGDAGIRSTGNLNIAASQVLNADNISVGGSSSGVPATPTASTTSIAGLSASTSSTAATTAAASDLAAQSQPQQANNEQAPSMITVEVLGYGGSEDRGDEEDEVRG